MISFSIKGKSEFYIPAESFWPHLDRKLNPLLPSVWTYVINHFFRAQLRAAQAAASDLFGFEDDRPADTKVTSLVTSTAGLSLNNPDSIDTYVPVDPEDFAELSRRVVKKLKNYQVTNYLSE